MNSVLVRILARSQASRGRVIMTSVLIGLLFLGAIAANGVDASDGAAEGLVRFVGFGLIVPVGSLLFASATLGDLVEDETLVYVWLRPLHRLVVAASAFAAALAAVIPVAVLATAGTLLLAGQVGSVGGAVLGSALGAAAYAGVFVALGAFTSRSLLWGLLYVIIWEGVLTNVSRGFARFSIDRYATSLFAAFSDAPPPNNPASVTTSVLALVGTAAAGVLLTWWVLARRDVP